MWMAKTQGKDDMAGGSMLGIFEWSGEVVPWLVCARAQGGSRQRLRSFYPFTPSFMFSQSTDRWDGACEG